MLQVLGPGQRFTALPVDDDEVAVRLHRDEVDAAREPLLVAIDDPFGAVCGKTWPTRSRLFLS
jgi:hypothetical protein